MCNCGSRSQRRAGDASSAAHLAQRDAAGQALSVEFTYLGRSALTTIGPATGNTYRFLYPGARLPVALADVAALAQVPRLRSAVR